MSHDHDHDHDHDELALRAAALEAVLVEKGLLTTDQIDAIVERYERDLGPQNGARVVARAWVDADYRERLLADGAAAIGELGYGGFEGDTMVVVENTPDVHNVVVCTLCSCYPWPVLGLPPTWYKSPAYRARVVAEPRVGAPRVRARASLRDRRSACGTRRARSATSSCRSDRRGPRAWSEESLAALVTRDSMIGTGLPSPPA